MIPHMTFDCQTRSERVRRSEHVCNLAHASASEVVHRHRAVAVAISFRYHWPRAPDGLPLAGTPVDWGPDLVTFARRTKEERRRCEADGNSLITSPHAPAAWQSQPGVV